MDIFVFGDGTLSWRDQRVRCALGRDGLRADKREGDGCTPLGRFPLRRVLFRPDREPVPQTVLPVTAIDPDLGWCDDPADVAYNRPVRLPFGASHERMWRDDGLYDLLAVIGHNDEPVEPGFGSAVFLHVAAPEFAPTEGCVALSRNDLAALLACCRAADRLCILSGKRKC